MTFIFDSNYNRTKKFIYSMKLNLPYYFHSSQKIWNLIRRCHFKVWLVLWKNIINTAKTFYLHMNHRNRCEKIICSPIVCWVLKFDEFTRYSDPLISYPLKKGKKLWKVVQLIESQDDHSSHTLYFCISSVNNKSQQYLWYLLY